MKKMNLLVFCFAVLFLTLSVHASSVEPRGCYFVEIPENLSYGCDKETILIADNIEKVELLEAPASISLIKTMNESLEGLKIYGYDNERGRYFSGYIIVNPTDGGYVLRINDEYEIGLVYNIFNLPFTFYFWVAGIALMVAGFLLFFFTKNLFQKLGHLLIGVGLCASLLFSIPYDPIPFLILLAFAILSPIAIFLIKRDSKEAKWMDLIKTFIITIMVFILIKGFIF